MKVAKLPQRRSNDLQRLWIVAGFACIALLHFASPAGAQCPAEVDSSWTVTVNGQTVQVNPDGTFKIPNVPAPDQFGLGGPGTSPDFFSDDFIRVVATRTENGVTCYAFSEPFQFFNNDTYRIQGLTFTIQPPPVPTGISMSAPTQSMMVGDMVQLTVTGTLPDGSGIDLTPRSAWTTYRTSNPMTATVGPDGLIEAQNPGVTVISAQNEGTIASMLFGVAPVAPTTKVLGFTLRSDGTPVDGATVMVVGHGQSAMSDAEGFFSIDDVPSDGGPLTITATANVAGEDLVGIIANIPPLTGMCTDAGLLYMVGEPAFFATGDTGLPGEVVESFVLLDISFNIRGWSFGLCQDQSDLLIVDAVLGQTTLTVQNGGLPGFFSIDIEPEGVAMGVVIDFQGVFVLEAGNGYQLLEASYGIIGAPGTNSDICFCTMVGPIPIAVVVTNESGNSFPPNQNCGTVSIGIP